MTNRQNENALAPQAQGPTIVIGEILVEIVATTIGDGFSEPIPLLGPYPSGAPAIFAAQAASMGSQTAMLGTVGDDDFGALVRTRLTRHGVDTSYISIDRTRPTGTAFVRYRADGTRDFVYNIEHSAAGQITLDETLVASAGHLHIMGSAIATSSVWSIIERAARAIKSRGGTISVDPNIRKELMRDNKVEARMATLLGLTDLLLPSGDELLAVSASATEADAISELRARGISEIVVKQGANGAYGVNTELRASVNAFAVDEVDPTGAGDCFGGAYVAARRLGLSMQVALEYGAAAGACNVSVRGPMEGVRNRMELDQFVKSNTEIKL